MASSFKTIDPKDIVSTRNLLHEAIPLTGTIVSGTYGTANIKNYVHGMFQSVYDYPYLSSSANHIFDIAAGYSNGSECSASTNTQNSKKVNIYNELAQILVGVISRIDESLSISNQADQLLHTHDESYWPNPLHLHTFGKDLHPKAEDSY